MADTLRAAGFDLIEPFDARAITDPRLAVLRESGRARGLLVGNTRALWEPFARARAADPALAAARDPLDRYVERCLGAAFPGANIYYAHARHGGAFVPLQHLAVAIGVGALSPGHLVIHPTYGPWFALRAAILVDGAPPPPRAPIAQPCQCGEACRATLSRALAGGGPTEWLAVRDACTLREHRYTDEQVRYHYDRAWPSD